MSRSQVAKWVKNRTSDREHLIKHTDVHHQLHSRRHDSISLNWRLDLLTGYDRDRMIMGKRRGIDLKWYAHLVSFGDVCVCGRMRLHVLPLKRKERKILTGKSGEFDDCFVPTFFFNWWATSIHSSYANPAIPRGPEKIIIIPLTSGELECPLPDPSMHTEFTHKTSTWYLTIWLNLFNP